MPSRFQLITELYDKTVQGITDSYSRWTGFLRAACHNYKCPFDEQILIYAQRPDATAVLEMDKWNRQFGRWVNRGAKSIAVFGDDGLKLYFDVSDTHETSLSRSLPIWTMHPDFESAVIEALENTFGDLAEKDSLVNAVRSAAHNAVADNLPDYLQDLFECREDSLLEELDAIGEVGFLASIPLWLVTILGCLVIIVLSFVMILTVYSRFFKLYLYTAFAPIPLSSFSGETTSFIGKAFLKSYMGVCLEGAVIVLACMIFSAFASDGNISLASPDSTAVVQVLSYLAETIFHMLVLVGLVKGADRVVKEMLAL